MRVTIARLKGLVCLLAFIGAVKGDICAKAKKMLRTDNIYCTVSFPGKAEDSRDRKESG